MNQPMWQSQILDPYNYNSVNCIFVHRTFVEAQITLERERERENLVKFFTTLILRNNEGDE